MAVVNRLQVCFSAAALSIYLSICLFLLFLLTYYLKIYVCLFVYPFSLDKTHILQEKVATLSICSSLLFTNTKLILYVLCYDVDYSYRNLNVLNDTIRPIHLSGMKVVVFFHSGVLITNIVREKDSLLFCLKIIIKKTLCFAAL